MTLFNRLLTLIPLSFAAVSFALTILLLVAGSSHTTAPTHFWLALNKSRLGQNLIEITPTDTYNPLSPIVEGLFGDLRDDLIDGLGQRVQDLQGALVGNLTEWLGVRDAYALFVRNICEGEFESRTAGSGIKLNKCVPYEEKSAGLRQIASSIPSSFALGPANVSIPLVEALSSTLDSALSLATEGARALFALLVISAIATGTTLVVSLMTVILGQRRWTVRINPVASLLGTFSLPLFAVVATAVILIGSSALKGVGAGVGLEVRRGGGFLGVSWAAAALVMGSGGWWFMVWFVGFRRTSFKRRVRTEEEVGDWRGIMDEVWGDLRIPKEEREKRRTVDLIGSGGASGRRVSRFGRDGELY